MATTYNLRYVDSGEWYRGYRTRRLDRAKAQARLVAETTSRPVDVYGGEGPYRNVVYETPEAVHYRQARGVR